MAEQITGAVGNKLVQLKNVTSGKVIAQVVVPADKVDQAIKDYEKHRDSQPDKADLKILTLSKV